MADSGRTVFGRGAGASQPSIIDPSTYQSDFGAGFTLELANGPATAYASGALLWDTVYPINDDSGETAVDNALFTWDPATETYGSGQGAAHCLIKQSGLYVVQYRVDFNTITLDVPGNNYYALEALTGQLDLRSRDYFPSDITSARRVRWACWIPEGDIQLSISGNDFDLDLTEIGYASFTIAPMFTLTGIEES